MDLKSSVILVKGSRSTNMDELVSFSRLRDIKLC